MGALPGFSLHDSPFVRGDPRNADQIFAPRIGIVNLTQSIARRAATGLRRTHTDGRRATLPQQNNLPMALAPQS
jgi:hypothetical protein